MKGLLKKLWNSVGGISELDFFMTESLAKELGIYDKIDYETDSQNGTLKKDEKDVNENEDESISESASESASESDSEFHDWD